MRESPGTDRTENIPWLPSHPTHRPVYLIRWTWTKFGEMINNLHSLPLWISTVIYAAGAGRGLCPSSLPAAETEQNRLLCPGSAQDKSVWIWISPKRYETKPEFLEWLTKRRKIPSSFPWGRSSAFGRKPKVRAASTNTESQIIPQLHLVTELLTSFLRPRINMEIRYFRA